MDAPQPSPVVRSMVPGAAIRLADQQSDDRSRGVRGERQPIATSAAPCWTIRAAGQLLTPVLGVCCREHGQPGATYQPRIDNKCSLPAARIAPRPSAPQLVGGDQAAARALLRQLFAEEALSDLSASLTEAVVATATAVAHPVDDRVQADSDRRPAHRRLCAWAVRHYTPS
jgi:hypothetical protein